MNESVLQEELLIEGREEYVLLVHIVVVSSLVLLHPSLLLVVVQKLVDPTIETHHR